MKTGASLSETMHEGQALGLTYTSFSAARFGIESGWQWGQRVVLRDGRCPSKRTWAGQRLPDQACPIHKVLESLWPV